MSYQYPMDPTECLLPRTLREADMNARCRGESRPALGDWLDESAPIDQRWDVAAVLAAIVAAAIITAIFIF